MIKKIESNNKIFQSDEFQKDKYKFFIILQNLNSENLELCSNEKIMYYVEMVKNGLHGYGQKAI